MAPKPMPCPHSYCGYPMEWYADQGYWICPCCGAKWRRRDGKMVQVKGSEALMRLRTLNILYGMLFALVILAQVAFLGFVAWIVLHFVFKYW